MENATHINDLEPKEQYPKWLNNWINARKNDASHPKIESGEADDDSISGANIFSWANDLLTFSEKEADKVINYCFEPKTAIQVSRNLKILWKMSL